MAVDSRSYHAAMDGGPKVVVRHCIRPEEVCTRS